jgi:hypothetical protein
MSFESLMKEWQTLNLSMEALAALGAELRLRRECSSDNSQVRALLRKAVDHLHPGLLDDIDPNQELAALALIQASFRQAIDLLENPGRAPRWSYEDPAILESQGQASRLIVRGMETLAGQRPGSMRRCGDRAPFLISEPESDGLPSRRRAAGLCYESLASTFGSPR